MSKAKKIGLIGFIIIVLISAVATYFIVQIQDNLNSLTQLPIEDIDLTSIENGSYIGEYKVFPVEVILEVTVQDHEIESILILKHDNGQGEEAEEIISSVLISQSIEVDSIAGATYSSKVILLAIKEALN